MHNKFRKAVCLLMTLVMRVMCMPITVHAEITAQGIDGAFAPTWSDVAGEYERAFQWKEANILSKEWDDGDTHYERQTGSQAEFFRDNVLTTHQYLGLGIDDGSVGGGWGGGIGGSCESIVQVALGELGKPDSLENPSNSNQVKYNDWYWGRAGAAYEWCAAFVCWCANQCGLLGDVIPKNASCSSMFNQLRNSYGYAYYRVQDTTPWGGSAYTPVPGDLMFFSKTGNLSESKPFEHIGIIVEVEADGWYTVEGNTTGGGQIPGGGVAKNHFTRRTTQARVRNGYVVHVEYPKNEIVQGSNNIETTYKFITEVMGLNSAAACGIIANMNEESRGLVADQDEIGGGGGYGICQWTNTKYANRKDDLIEWCGSNGYDFKTLEGQLWFFRYEIGKPAFAKLMSTLRTVPDTADGASKAAEAFCREYEIPKNVSAAVEVRTKSAVNTFWPQYGSK